MELPGDGGAAGVGLGALRWRNGVVFGSGLELGCAECGRRGVGALFGHHAKMLHGENIACHWGKLNGNVARNVAGTGAFRGGYLSRELVYEFTKGCMG